MTYKLYFHRIIAYILKGPLTEGGFSIRAKWLTAKLQTDVLQCNSKLTSIVMALAAQYRPV